MSTLLEHHHVAERDGMRIAVHALPAINRALVHNGVPLLAAIEVTNESASDVMDLTVEVRLQSDGRTIAPVVKRTEDGRTPPGLTVVFDDFAEIIPAAAELDTNEAVRATLTVLVSSLWSQTAQLTVPLDVLAHNEWFNTPILYDSLAAFVQPNTSAVASVLTTAAEILEKETGNPSFNGYDGGPERVALVAAAIYEALHSRKITYVPPPASFEDTGQKIRTTSQVLELGLGTCIDLSVTYASCLEAAGVRPLLWLVRGHAFAGFLLQEKTLSSPSITETNALINLVESGLAVPVDALYFKPGTEGGFKAAVASGRRFFAEPDNLLGVVGVNAARKDGILPLPSVDELVVVDTKETRSDSTGLTIDLPTELLATGQTEDVAVDDADPAPARVRKWKRALLDLTTRNRLLNLRTSVQVIDLHVPSGGLANLDDLAHEGKPITLTPHDALSTIHELQGARFASELDTEILRKYLSVDHTVYAAVGQEAYTRRFKTLARAARTMFEETGASNLYLTLGALIHPLSTGKEARAPLFLLPVKIIGGTGRSPYQFIVDTSAVASPNHCLVQWLRLKHNVTIEALASPPEDDYGIDITRAFREIRTALVDNKLDFRIDEVATVSICQFGTYGMWRDLDESWEVFERSPIVNHLAFKPGETFEDPKAADDTHIEHIAVDETAVPVPIPADGSQLRAVALAAQGRTFVLEGPPGTGKSQTITNLIAHSLSKGQTVLFVAEKQAALDVVKKRLTNIGLADFMLDLHGKSQQPKEIREQLRRAIENDVRYNGNGWAVRLSEFRGKYTAVADYPQKVHRRNGADESLWNAYESLLTADTGAVAPIPTAYVVRPPVDRHEVQEALTQFARAAQSMSFVPGSPWSIAGPGGSATAEDLTRAAAPLEKVRQESQKIDASLLQQISRPTEVSTLLPQARRQLGYPIPESATVARWHGVQFTKSREALLAEIADLRQNSAPLLGVFTPMFLKSGDVDVFVTKAEEAGRGMFGKKKRAEDFEQEIAPFVVADADRSPGAILPLLRAVPVVREHTARVHDQMLQVLGVYAPELWNPLADNAAESLDDAFDYIRATSEFIREHPEVWAQLVASGFPDERQLSVLIDMVTAWNDWLTALGTTPEDFARWTNGRHWTKAWEEDREQWQRDVELGSRQLLTWSRASGFLETARSAGLHDYVQELLAGRIKVSDVVPAFIRGVAQASLKERRATEGLEVFDTALRDGEISDFVAAAAALREEQTKALPAQLLERRPFKANALKGSVGELRRLLDRKRGGPTLRQLMERYGDDILAAAPVVFVSPASLAQFIPPGSVTFDLVVFDEASQVTVPQAIGALGRARSAIIVGDSQQMPPTSIGQVSINDDDETDDGEGIAPDDLESILTECVDSGLPQLWLSWHYRSQDESLINFSNQKYYEGRLASLPSPGGDPTAGVEWRRVEGHFNREDKKNGHRTNRVEAEAIVEEIQSRLATPHLAGQSIGVVTFNQQQQTLILDLLEATDDPLVRERLRPEHDEGIFVKNLENVQGDERDVILFSAAFSKKPGETKLPLNFGPLSTTGGEKRFNVAVTRARRKVVVFTSFDPSDIELSRTRSVGLAHLRAYLEMAEHGVAGGLDVSGSKVTDTDLIQTALRDALRARGYEVETDFGLSEFVLDLVVRKPESPRWQVAILLDGPRWAERATVSDRDLTPQLLEPMMHWGAALRVWLPDWIDSPDKVLDRVDSALVEATARQSRLDADIEAAAAARADEIERTRKNPPGESAELSIPEEEDLEWHTGDDDVLIDDDDTQELVAHLVVDTPVPGTGVKESAGERDWHGRPAAYLHAPDTVLGVKEDLNRVNSVSVRKTITEAAREVIDIEGPIELSRLAAGIGHRFGLSRVSAQRKELIVSCVPESLVVESELGTFAWPDTLDPDDWRGFREGREDFTRPLNETAPQEIVNAMNAVCQQRGLDEETLMRDTLAIFGQRRLTGPSTDRLAACLDLGLKSGRLVRIGGQIRAGA